MPRSGSSCCPAPGDAAAGPDDERDEPTTLGKALAGTMVGLALVAILSLAWIARRVGKRGRLGRGTRVVVRSAWALLFGLAAGSPAPSSP